MGEGVPANASWPQVFLFRLARGLCMAVSPEAPSARFLQGLPTGTLDNPRVQLLRAWWLGCSTHTGLL